MAEAREIVQIALKNWRLKAYANNISWDNFSVQVTNNSNHTAMYSCLPIKQAGSNKQAGWIISETLTNKQAVINKQGGILVSIQ